MVADRRTGVSCPGCPQTRSTPLTPRASYRADNHGWFIATSGGRRLPGGPVEDDALDQHDRRGQHHVGRRPGHEPGDEMNGNAVLYDVNKILAVGGAPSYQNSNAVEVANTINISGTSPKVTSTAPMANARAFAQ